MSTMELDSPHVLAGSAPPPERPPSLFRLLFGRIENQFEALPRAVYEQPVWNRKTLFGHTFIVSDPLGVKRVLLDNVANYPKAKRETDLLAAIAGEGLLVSQGDKWRAHRRLMAPSFDFKSILAYAPDMVRTAGKMAETWSAKGAGSVVDIHDEMTMLTLEIISRTMFSADAEQLGQLVDRSLRNVFAHIDFGLMDMLPLIGPPRMRKKLARLHEDFMAMDASMQKLISARVRNPGDTPRDLLDRLIAARDGETGVSLNNEEVRDEVVIIFLAGHDTTALALTYAWYLLSQHPEAEARMHAELDSVLGGRPPEHDDLARLPFTRMVLEEAMRLYPPAPGFSLRATQADDEIGGVRVPKGSQVWIAPWVIHRHRTLWENPERFDPDRFSPERSAGRHRFAYLPFGAGPRVCIGMALAMAEAQLVLATLAQRFRLSMVPGQEIVLQHRITMRPRDGIRMTLVPR